MAYGRINVDYGAWGIVGKTAWAILITCGITAALVFIYVPSIRQSAALQKEIEIKREALKKQMELQQKYDEELRDLRSNPEAVERAAREKLKLVKPNEMIYIFESSKSR